MSKNQDRQVIRPDINFGAIEETAAVITLKRFVIGLSISFGIGFSSSIAATMAMNSVTPPQCPPGYYCIPTAVWAPKTDTPGHPFHPVVIDPADLGTFSGAP